MLEYSHIMPSLQDIREFFYETNDDFDIPLDQKLNIEEYTQKLYTYSDFFLCYEDDKIIGMLCCYTNRPPDAYISHVCVKSQYQGKGIFKELFKKVEDYCRDNYITSISLEVGCDNLVARSAYEKVGFVLIRGLSDSLILRKDI